MSIIQCATSLVKSIQSRGFVAVFAGGAVRDQLLSLPLKDIDIATDASPDQLLEIFPRAQKVGKHFGVLIVKKGNYSFELATFRKEGSYSDGRHPDHITHASMEEDAGRRDFTINGMFYDPVREEIFDFVGGQEDLKKGVLRSIGDVHLRFCEDRLRILRAVRFAVRFGFSIEPHTFGAMQNFSKDLFPAVSKERVVQELKGMLHMSSCHLAFSLLKDAGLLPILFEKADRTANFDLLRGLDEILPVTVDPLCLVSAIYSRREDLMALKEELHFPNDALRFFAHYGRLLELTDKEVLDDAECALFCQDPCSRSALYLYTYLHGGKHALACLNEREDHLSIFIRMLQNNTPVIQSKDLMERGMRPGRELGDFLDKALRISINEKITDKEELFAKLGDLPCI